MGSPMVLDLMLVALAITLDPLPLMAFVLVVASARGVRTGLAFIAGWTACFVAVLVLVLTLTGGRPPEPRSPPSTAGLALRLAIGAGLVAYGVRRHLLRRRGRDAGGRRDRTARAPSGDDASPGPSGGSSSFLSSRLERGAVWPAAVLAVLLQPWGLVAAGGLTVVDADGDHTSTWFVLVGFCLLATASLLVVETYIAVRPERARRRLLAMRAWMADHAHQAIVAGSVLIGLYLVGKSAYGLAG
ncbi:GAP family protein [Streptomyces sp. NPDC004822]|uniref:GAP family protein n=1 Tax=Streptomyces sp. SS1-1 TaxID=2651869 RepID=UPI001CEF8DB0|nr:GAP family protein [Streptomyces sp. SS1-1]